jgi:hypothetical protein
LPADAAKAESALVQGDPIATLTQVGGTTATVSISTDLSSPIRVGDLLAVLSGPTLFLAEVLHLETRELRTHASLSLLATVDHTSLTLTQGVSRLPLPGSLTYRPSVALIKAHLEARSSLFADLTHHVTIELGTSHHCPAQPLSFSPEKLLGRHCAVLGTSGSGKSWSLARLMEECARLRGKAILIDPSGEYRALSGPVRHVHFGEPPSLKEGSSEVSLPYYQLMDEAHQMLPKTVSALSNEYPLEALNVIAKEGRKYGLTLCIAT